MAGGQKALFYILSFFIPIVGIVLGIIWMNDVDVEKKSAGKNCLIIAIVSIVISCIFWFALTALSLIPSYGYY